MRAMPRPGSCGLLAAVLAWILLLASERLELAPLIKRPRTPASWQD